MTKMEKVIINQLRKNALEMLKHYIFSSIDGKTDSSNFHDVSTALTYNSNFLALEETIKNVDMVDFKLKYNYQVEEVNGLYAKAKKELLKLGLNYNIHRGIVEELNELKATYIQTNKCKKEENDFFRTFETFVWFIGTKLELEEMETAYKNGLDTSIYSNYELPKQIEKTKGTLKTEKAICVMELKSLRRNGKLKDFVNSEYGFIPAEFSKYIADIEQHILRNEIY